MRTILKRTSITVLLGGLLLSAAGRAVPEDSRVPLRDGEYVIQKRVPSWKEIRERNIVMQKRDYSCGAAALATILHYYWGDPITEEDVLRSLLVTLTPEETKDRIKHGLAISDLRRGSVKMGYLSSIGTMTLDKLSQSRVPLIVPLKLEQYDHFAVFRGIVDGRVYLADPIRGNVRPTLAEFQCQWQKHAVLVVAKPGEGLRDQSPLCIREGEVFLGETNRQLIRGELPAPFVHSTR